MPPTSRNSSASQDESSCRPDTKIIYHNDYATEDTVSLRKITEQDNFDFGSSDRAWVDINGDNRIDHCATNGKNKTVCMISEDNDKYEKISEKINDIGWSDSRYWININGDGKTDYCRVIDNKTELRGDLSTASGYVEKEITSAYIDAGHVNTRGLADINGDKN